MSTKIIAAFLVALAAVGGGAFYGGTVYAKSKVDPRAAGRGAAAFAGGAFAGRNGAGAQRGAGGFTAGEVLSKDATSLTLKLADGGSKNVFLSASTTVSMTAAGSLDDVKPGTNVSVTGAANQDGSVTASTIQIRPAGAPAARQLPAQ